MSLPNGWLTVVELNGVDPAVLDSFRDCTLVESVEGFARYERSLQFRMSWTADDAWYLRPGRGDADSDVGRPGTAELARLLMDTVHGVWLDVADDWDIDVRQVRTVVTAPSLRVVEPAPDGYEYLMVAVLGRDRPADGQVRLHRRGDAQLCWEGSLNPGQALLMDPRVVTPDMGTLLTNGAGPGRQDVLVNGFSRAGVMAGEPDVAPVPPGRP